jgi:hypothetical protein
MKRPGELWYFSCEFEIRTVLEGLGWFGLDSCGRECAFRSFTGKGNEGIVYWEV